MKRIATLVVAIFCSSPDLACYAKDQPLFLDDTILQATLTAPLSVAYGQKEQEDRDFLRGRWEYLDDAGKPQPLAVSIRARGNFRRLNCDLPPLQLNFKKSEVGDSVFAGQNKLKLVSPCAYGKNHQQRLILEYLAYRTLEVLTEHSLRTRLLKLNYVDERQSLKLWSHLAFLIEDTDEMARRLSMQRARLPKVNSVQLDKYSMALVEIFQLLIANNDYSLLRGQPDAPCCHNIDIVGSDDASNNLIPIPYDFDFSGLVNAPYARPQRNMRIRTVRTRKYRGRCVPPDVWDQVVKHVQSKQLEVNAVYEDSAELNASMKRKTLRYIRAFFETIDNPQSLQRKVFSQCRGQKYVSPN